MIKTPCESCQGSGRIKKKHKVRVKIPAGIDSGYRLRVTGAGDAGQKGATAGDLYVFINVEAHPLFERERNNLYHRLKLSFTQAILGDEIKVPIINGKTSLKIPRGTQPNTTFRIKGHGMPSLEGREHGDLYILVEVEIPTKLSKNQEELLRNFKNA